MDYSVFTWSSQCVVVDNRYSSWSNVISGVPQGSVLGPMLVISFINDISNITVHGVFTKLYADDLKIYTSLISTDDCKQFTRCSI